VDQAQSHATLDFGRGRTFDATALQLIEIVLNERVEVRASVLDREHARNVIADVKVPGSSLNELSVDEKRLVAVEIDVTDMRVSVNDPPGVG
jgi:hypothetical protein